jgi:hypothetical protein
MIDRPAAAKNTQVRIVGDRAALLQTVFIVHWYNAVDQGPVFSGVLSGHFDRVRGR